MTSARLDAIAERYRTFAAREARGVSELYTEWSEGVAADAEVLGLLAELPTHKQQPNLIFAAARVVGIPTRPYGAVRADLLRAWPSLISIVRRRSTQTNEAARDAVLLPLLAALPQPLSLIEVGASAGLCLYPDRYSYEYSGSPRIDPREGPSSVVLRCRISGPVPVPVRLPEVVSRTGVDLNPIDVDDPDELAWLEALVWPEHEERRQRLRMAAEIARSEPARIVRGDLNENLVALVTAAARESTVVVFHTAVLSYLDPPSRDRFEAQVLAADCIWIANEAVGTIPSVQARLPGGREQPDGAFALSIDGLPVAYAGAHGQWIDWFDPSPV